MADVSSDGKKPKDMAALIAEKHERGTLTLAIVNTVERAQEVYRALTNARGKLLPDAEKVLVHSRFREEDRRKKNKAIARKPEGGGLVVVATQAVEAGVDISARTLITELAPWPSMVQRFGRCNRTGECAGQVFWVDVEDKNAAPYEAEDMQSARAVMKSLEKKSAGPADLAKLDDDALGGPDHPVVVRRRDVVGLFDTTPDLSGSYLDVSQYVRGRTRRTCRCSGATFLKAGRTQTSRKYAVTRRWAHPLPAIAVGVAVPRA